MPQVKLNMMWMARFWILSICWLWSFVRAWCQTGTQYSRTGRTSKTVKYGTKTQKTAAYIGANNKRKKSNHCTVRSSCLFSVAWRSMHGMAAAYLTELCTSVAASASRRGGLRSSTTSDLVIPRCRLSTYGTRAFSVAGPVFWNALSDYLKSPDIDCFRQQLKIFFVSTTLAH